MIHDIVNEAREYAFLTCFQVMLIQLAQRPTVESLPVSKPITQDWPPTYPSRRSRMDPRDTLAPAFGFGGLPIFFSGEFLPCDTMGNRYIWFCLGVSLCANEMTGSWGLLRGFRMGTGDQKDQGIIRG